MPRATGAPWASLALVLGAFLCLPATAQQTAQTASTPGFDEQLASLTASNPKAVLAEANAILATPSGVPAPRQLTAWRNIAVTAMELGDNGTARRAIEAGEALATRLGNASADCVFRSLRANLVFTESLKEADIGAFDPVLAYAIDAELPHCLAYSTWLKGLAYSTLDRAADALDHFLRAHAQYETLQDRIAVASLLSSILSVYRLESIDAGATRKAKEYATRALQLIDERRHPNLASTIHHDLAVAFLDGREWREARPHIDAALRLSGTIGDTHGAAYSLRLLARVELEEKRFREALSAAERALPEFADNRVPDLELNVRLVRAGALAGLHREREALAELERCRAIVRRLEASKYRVMFHRMAAEVYATLRDYPNAYAEAVRLNDAQAAYSHEANVAKAASLQGRFEAQQRETENRLLRAEQRAERASTTALWLALGMCAALIISLLAYLLAQNRQKRRMSRLATRDELTGLRNRRSVLEFARAALKRTPPAGMRFCIALLDIDHFKRINDTWGHQAGDEALVAFAHACRANLQDDFELGRFGGEEFMLVMPAIEEDAVPAIFQRLRDALRKEASRPQGMDPLTFSMGYAFVRNEIDLGDAMVRADKALYEAKRQGRDRWCAEMPAGAGPA